MPIMVAFALKVRSVAEPRSSSVCPSIKARKLQLEGSCNNCWVGWRYKNGCLGIETGNPAAVLVDDLGQLPGNESRQLQQRPIANQVVRKADIFVRVCCPDDLDTLGDLGLPIAQR